MTINEENYTTTCDCKERVPLTDDEKNQIVDYFKKHGHEINSNDISQRFMQVDERAVPVEVIEKKIYRLFKKLEISPAYAGYEYLSCAIMDCLRSRNRRIPIGRLYKSIGEKYGKSYTCVERSLRFVKEKLIKSSSSNVRQMVADIFGTDSTNKLTNGNFVSGLYLYIKYEIGI